MLVRSGEPSAGSFKRSARLFDWAPGGSVFGISTERRKIKEEQRKKRKKISSMGPDLRFGTCKELESDPALFTLLGESPKARSDL